MITALLLGLQQPATEAMAKAVDLFFSQNKAVGLSVAVVQNGKVIFRQEKGFANREQQSPVAPDTLFRLASVSKPITATGVMKLVEKGKLDLDANVRQYIPELPASSPVITLRQLLSHTAGIHHYNNKTEPPDTQFFAHSKPALAYFIKDDLVAQPGEKYSYSTHAFTFVSRAMEQASGASFITFMRSEVFGGLGLDCEVSRDVKPARSALYTLASSGTVTREKVREDLSWKFGGGGMEATATGLATWGAKLMGRQIVRESSLNEMWTPTKLSDGKFSQYGLGFSIGAKRERVTHNGAQQGARSSFMLDLKTKTVVVVLTNTSGNMNVDGLAKSLLDGTAQ